MKRLTIRKVETAGPGRHGDGNGLYLVVSETGSRKWVLRIQVNGRRRDIGLGSASNIGLAEVREAAEDLRRAVRRGEDPLVEKRRSKAIIPTFSETAKQVHKEHAPSWKNKKHASQWLTTLEQYILPKFGDLPVNQIDGAMVRDALIAIWLDIPETARRVLQRVGTVLDYAHAKGWRDTEAPIRSIRRGLPKQPKKRQHMPALPWQDIPEFIGAMNEKIKASTKVQLAIEFVILTACRSGEARGARWSEFDLEEGIWIIPAERMKAGREHRVPLSDRSIEILEDLAKTRRTTDPSEHVFEGRKGGRPLSDMTLSMPIRRAELPFTIHGFRSAFRDWCAEATNTPREIAEACLAHVVRNKSEAAYARTDHLERRKLVMQAWADFCSNADSQENVVAMHGVKR